MLILFLISLLLNMDKLELELGLQFWERLKKLWWNCLFDAMFICKTINSSQSTSKLNTSKTMGKRTKDTIERMTLCFFKDKMLSGSSFFSVNSFCLNYINHKGLFDFDPCRSVLGSHCLGRVMLVFDDSTADDARWAQNINPTSTCLMITQQKIAMMHQIKIAEEQVSKFSINRSRVSNLGLLD